MPALFQRGSLSENLEDICSFRGIARFGNRTVLLDKDKSISDEIPWHKPHLEMTTESKSEAAAKCVREALTLIQEARFDMNHDA